MKTTENKFTMTLHAKELDTDTVEVSIRSYGEITSEGVARSIYAWIKYCEQQFPEQWYNAMNHAIDDMLGKGEEE